MIPSPCKKHGVDCTKRFVGCHDTCKEYLDYLKLKEQEYEHRRKNAQLLDDAIKTSRKQKRRYRRYQ